MIENLIAAAPASAAPFFYRTAAGAEIDLVLEIPGHGLWAIEIKRGPSARPDPASNHHDASARDRRSIRREDRRYDKNKHAPVVDPSGRT